MVGGEKLNLVGKFSQEFNSFAAVGEQARRSGLEFDILRGQRKLWCI
jgi:hypothetical protein